MARPKKTKVTIEKPSSKKTSAVISSNPKNESLFEKMQLDLQKNQSILNYVLGGLIVIVVGVLLFNYFSKPQGNVGSSSQTENQKTEAKKDVAKDNLPGKYTIKDGDTLFTIAQQYYGDGYKYSEIVKENKLADENMIEVGQLITIPKLQIAQAEEKMASPSPEAMDKQTVSENMDQGTGGAENATIWGERITGDRYTVQEGDWLSKISGRAYGDIEQYSKLAEANNISNPDTIEVGTILKLPR